VSTHHTPMPDIHVPHLDDEPEQPAAATVRTDPVPHQSRRWKSGLKLVLEVVLVSIGVFLGLAGEQWRENRRHHELADVCLKRFQAEFRSNRAEVLRVRDRHVKELKDLQAYFNAHRDELTAHIADIRKPVPLPVPDTVTDSAGVDFSAWDLALATQSLAYLDPDLVAEMSSTYRLQEIYLGAHRAIQQTAYSFTDFVYYLRGLMAYFDDASLYEELLLKRYENILERLDKTSAER
jgi:hypothetical protein